MSNLTVEVEDDVTLDIRYGDLVLAVAEPIAGHLGVVLAVHGGSLVLFLGNGLCADALRSQCRPLKIRRSQSHCNFSEIIKRE